MDTTTRCFYRLRLADVQRLKAAISKHVNIKRFLADKQAFYSSQMKRAIGSNFRLGQLMMVLNHCEHEAIRRVEQFPNATAGHLRIRVPCCDKPLHELVEDFHTVSRLVRFDSAEDEQLMTKILNSLKYRANLYVVDIYVDHAKAGNAKAGTDLVIDHILRPRAALAAATN